MVEWMGAYISKEKSYRLLERAIVSKSRQNVLKSPSPVHFLTTGDTLHCLPLPGQRRGRPPMPAFSPPRMRQSWPPRRFTP